MCASVVAPAEGALAPECAGSVLRWAVDVAAWSPGAAELDYLLGLLPDEERAACVKFVREEDRKRALVSRLAQRAAAAAACGVPFEHVVIRRTRGRKPFSANRRPPGAPNFNFNVSHEGRYVVLASEHTCLCGVDVSAPAQLRRSGQAAPLDQALDHFREQLSPAEWALVRGFAPDERAMEAAFQRLWSCKEAFIKARGDGLGFEPLSRAEFRFAGGDALRGETAVLLLDGERQPRWLFHLHQLGHRHWVAVARGPPEAVVDAVGEFKSSLQRPVIDDGEMSALLAAPSPPFAMVEVEDLLPAEHRERCRQLADEAASAGG